MADEKQLKVRVQHKHDIEANWQKATNFIPKAGELIIYDPDANFEFARVKIGDGITLVSDLPFVGRQDDVVTYSEQSLTKEQQAQARENIGAITADDAVSAAFKNLGLIGKEEPAEIFSGKYQFQNGKYSDIVDSLLFSEGDVISLTIDDVTYTGVAKYIRQRLGDSDLWADGYYLGNIQDGEVVDNGWPYMIMSASISAPDGSVVYMLAITVISESDQSIDAEHEVSVYKFGDFNHINPVYLPKGGIGYTEKKLYTFDGDITDKVVAEEGIFTWVRITSDTPDFNDFVKAEGLYQGQSIELGKDMVVIQTVQDGAIQQARVPILGGPVALCVRKPTDTFPETGMYTFYDENTYITCAEFPEFVKIDPKYLPEGGVGYTETVVLTTKGSAEGKTTFTENGITYIRAGGRVNIADISLVSGIYQGEEMTVFGKYIQIENEDQNGNITASLDGVPAIYILTTNNPYSVSEGTYLLDMPDAGMQLISITVETEHPIDSKFVPKRIIDLSQYPIGEGSSLNGALINLLMYNQNEVTFESGADKFWQDFYEIRPTHIKINVFGNELEAPVLGGYMASGFEDAFITGVSVIPNGGQPQEMKSIMTTTDGQNVTIKLFLKDITSNESKTVYVTIDDETDKTSLTSEEIFDLWEQDMDIKINYDGVIGDFSLPLSEYASQEQLTAVFTIRMVGPGGLITTLPCEQIIFLKVDEQGNIEMSYSDMIIHSLVPIGIAGQTDPVGAPRSVLTLDENGMEFSWDVPIPTETTPGMVKAKPATEDMVDFVGLDQNGFLKVAPSSKTDPTLTVPGCAADAQVVGDRLDSFPIFSAIDGYTEIDRLRQATAITVTKSSANMIQLLTTLQGELEAPVQVQTSIELDSNGRPAKISTNGIDCIITWEGWA